jgi:hypothetical protein
MFSTRGLAATVVRAERTPDGWRVTVTEAGHRTFSTDVADGPPATVRATLTRWCSTNAQE